ncbi:hypothetical protein MKX03_005721 [Papaver bracteatum]|nr:hypothetical protein MKX03_005721 [Papaver bracteatum]
MLGRLPFQDLVSTMKKIVLKEISELPTRSSSLMKHVEMTKNMIDSSKGIYLKLLNASKFGKGATKDAKARKLASQHWVEAIDPRHRYGHSLHLYYEEWCNGDAGQPFFYWLDIGDGRDVELKECPGSKLRQQCIKYLGHIRSSTDNYEGNGDSKSVHGIAFESFSDITEAAASSKSLQIEIPNGEAEKDPKPSVPTEGPPRIEGKGSCKITLSGGLPSPKADSPKKEILEMINSKKATFSYQLGHQLSLKWSTGAGPRIGSVAHYHAELRRQAFHFVNLSPRSNAATSRQLA